MSTREYSITRIQNCCVRIPHAAASIRLASTLRNPLPFSRNPIKPEDGNQPRILDAITASQRPPPSPWPTRG
jgi:hypothetical protein